MAARRGAEFWRGHVADWRQSGLSQVAYCARHELNLKSFCRWRLKLHAATATALTLVPVSVGTPEPGNVIRLHSPGGWRIELPAGETPWLADLLRRLP